MATVELIDVRKSFGAVEAVAGVSLRIAQGEFVAMLGPSGCGKTTTLNLLAGFVDCRRRARSCIDGDAGRRRAAAQAQHRRGVPELRAVPALTVFDNVAFGLRMRKVAKRGDRERACAAPWTSCSSAALEERNTRQLSGGQQQRVALARALVIEPSLLLLDEPLSNLDANLREQMRFEIREIQQRVGITTVFVTHDQSEAMAAADRLVDHEQGPYRAGRHACVRSTARRAIRSSRASSARPTSSRQAVGVNGSQVQIELPNGDLVLAPRPAGLQGNGSVVVILRPEDLAISSAPHPGPQRAQPAPSSA